MIIKINANEEIIAYTEVGGIEGGIEIDESRLPVDFKEKYRPGFYTFYDQRIQENPNYEEPAAVAPDKSEIDALRDEIEELKAALEALLKGGK